MSTTWTEPRRHDFGRVTEETQKGRVRELIRSSGDEGLCSVLLYSLHLPNGRNRVVELRDDDGLDIETVPCDLRTYHRGERVAAHVRYVGRWWTTRQLKLIRI